MLFRWMWVDIVMQLVFIQQNSPRIVTTAMAAHFSHCFPHANIRQMENVIYIPLNTLNLNNCTQNNETISVFTGKWEVGTVLYGHDDFVPWDNSFHNFALSTQHKMKCKMLCMTPSSKRSNKKKGNFLCSIGQWGSLTTGGPSCTVFCRNLLLSVAYHKIIPWVACLAARGEENYPQPLLHLLENSVVSPALCDKGLL